MPKETTTISLEIAYGGVYYAGNFLLPTNTRIGTSTSVKRITVDQDIVFPITRTNLNKAVHKAIEQLGETFDETQDGLFFCSDKWASSSSRANAAQLHLLIPMEFEKKGNKEILSTDDDEFGTLEIVVVPDYEALGLAAAPDARKHGNTATP